MNEHFQLNVEDHPETCLVQTTRFGAQYLVQILLLFERYYVVEKQAGTSAPALLIHDEDCLRSLQTHGKLSKEQIQPLLKSPRIDITLDEPLSHSYQQLAISQFQALAPESTSRTAAYQQHTSTGAPSVQSSAPTPQQPIESTESTISAPPISQLTLPLVHQALEAAEEKQHDLAAYARRLNQELEQQSLGLKQALNQLPQIQSQLSELDQRLEAWQTQMEASHFSRDSLLQHTGGELESLQTQLQSILTQGLALQGVLREHQLAPDQQVPLKLQYLEEMLEHVVQQRHWVHYLKQQQNYAGLEQERLTQLKERYALLQEEIHGLKQAIEKIERTNQEILKQTPLAVPEPVPALALHELNRLEFELQLIEADPGLKEELA